jgi:hypothetical protein
VEICGVDSSGSGYGLVDDSCERGSEPSGVHKTRGTSRILVFQDDSATWNFICKLRHLDNIKKQRQDQSL